MLHLVAINHHVDDLEIIFNFVINIFSINHHVDDLEMSRYIIRHTG